MQRYASFSELKVYRFSTGELALGKYSGKQSPFATGLVVKGGARHQVALGPKPEVQLGEMSAVSGHWQAAATPCH
jgi:hypothetical protein